MIEPKVIKITKKKSSRGKNILNIYNNIELSIFDGAYLHYFDRPVITKEGIAKSAESRKQRLDIINKKKENINNKLFNHYFSYLNPSIILSRLRDASNERNKDLVKSINKQLTKMKYIVKNVPKDDKLKIKKNEKIIDIVERILELNSEN